MFENLTLYHYWRSSASWRIRWALEIKKLKPAYVHVDLLNGEVEQEPHLSRNPMGQVPALWVNGRMLIESMAIMEWLDEMLPANALFRGDAWDKAQIRALAEIINSGTQPIQNLLVMDKYSSDTQKRKEWNQFFISRGLTAFEKLASKSAGKFSVGNQITAADLCLIPQCYNAIRFELPLSQWPLLERIYNEALATPEGQASQPERFQPK